MDKNGLNLTHVQVFSAFCHEENFMSFIIIINYRIRMANKRPQNKRCSINMICLIGD